MAARRVRRVRRVRLVAVQGAAVGVAAVFLILAIAGFTPGLTTHLDALRWYGHHSGPQAALLDTFEVSVLRNLMHLGFGVAGLLMARTFVRARAYLIGGGLVYLALWIVGITQDGARDALPLNNADNWLHFAVGTVMVILGLTLAASRVPTGAEGELLIPE